MRAVILAAGLGTRLRPLTDETPKILLKVNGETLLSRQVRYLHSQGIAAIAMNTHHLAKQVEDHCNVEGSLEAMMVTLFHEPKLLGTAGALVPMHYWIGDDPFILLYGDTITNLDLSSLRLRPYDDAVLACSYSADAEGKGIVQVDRITFGVTAFLEKPSVPTPGVVFGGVALIRPQVLDKVRANDDFGRDIWPLLARRRRLAAQTFPRVRFHDVGTPESLAAAW